MKPIDIILIAVLALVVAAAVGYIVYKKKKGEKIGCGGGCAACPHAAACGGKAQTEKDGAQGNEGESEDGKTV